MNVKIRGEKGSTFAYILVVMVVSFLLVAGLIQITTSENNQVRYQTNEMKAYYIARAGAESVAMELERMDNAYYQYFYSGQQITQANNMLDGVGDAVVSVERVDEDGFYRIISTGTYQEAQATVKIMMEYRERSNLDFGVYAKETMDDVSIKDFDGDLGSGGDIEFKPAGDEDGVTGTVTRNTANNITIAVPEISDIYDALDQSGTFIDPSQAGIKLVKQTGGGLTPAEMMMFGEYDIDVDIRESMIISRWDDDYTGSIAVNTDFAKYYMQPYEDHEDTFELSTSNPGGAEKWLILYLEGEANFGKDATLDIYGNHNVMVIVEDGIEISGTINVHNDNRIWFYIMDIPEDNQVDLTIVKNTLIGVAGHPELLTFYLNPLTSRPIVAEIDSNPDFYGFIIGPEAIVNLKNGATTVYGGIYAKEVNIEASSSFHQLNPSDPNVILYKEMGIAYWE
ncbi:hypothetical protein QBE53_06265 [Vallitaleaceae bacterium 9-2]